MNAKVRQNKTFSKYGIVLLWLFFIAFLVRMVWIVQYQASPFFDNPSLDFTFFDLRAKDILQGQWFSDTYLFSPLYPMFLAFVYALFGTDLFFPRLIQALFGALLVFPVYHIAGYAFNRRTALIAAGISAFYLPLIYYDGILMATTLHVFFLTLSAAFLAGQLLLSRTFVSGLLMGIVLLAAPNYIIVTAAVALWILACPDHRFKKPSFIRAALFLTGALLVVSPVTLYHAVTHNEFVFVAPHGGINFYLGNHEHATGTYMTIPGISDQPGQQTLDSKRIASEALGRQVTNADVSAYWMRQSVDFLKTDPVAFLRLQLRKTALFWNAFEIPSEYGLDFDSRFHSLLRLPLPRFGWIAPLALTGLCMTMFSLQKRRALLPVFILFGIMFAVVSFFVHARYRMPATPWIIMFTGFCVSESIRYIREKYWKKMILTGVGVVLMTGFVYLPLENRNDLPGWFNRAHAYMAAGDLEAAEACLQEILRQDNSMKTWFLLGTLQMIDGRTSEAEHAFQNVLFQESDNYEALLNLGVLYFETEQYDKSLRLLERAVSLYPDRVPAQLALLNLYIKLKKPIDGREIVDTLINADLTAEERFRLENFIVKLRGISDKDSADDQMIMD
jgi:4-amino-4-deoxy-L-arabinose transferase-like glycosyltransferase